MNKFVKSLTAIAAATVMCGACFAMAGCGEGEDVDVAKIEEISTEFTEKMADSSGASMTTEEKFEIAINISGSEGGSMKMTISNTIAFKTMNDGNNKKIDEQVVYRNSISEYKDGKGNDLLKDIPEDKRNTTTSYGTYVRNGVTYSVRGDMLTDVLNGDSEEVFKEHLIVLKYALKTQLSQYAEVVSLDKDEAKKEMLEILGSVSIPGFGALEIKEENVSLDYSASLKHTENTVTGKLNSAIKVTSSADAAVKFEISANISQLAKINAKQLIRNSDFASVPTAEQVKEIAYLNPAADIAADFKENKAVSIDILGEGALGDNNANVNVVAAVAYSYDGGQGCDYVDVTVADKKVTIAANAYKSVEDGLKEHYGEEFDANKLKVESVDIMFDYRRIVVDENNSNSTEYGCSSILTFAL